ncbi:MAG: radical SAM protein, partial [Candidatus Omnitrophica bacterium]|nr:radical SAM protein [Candidatus Omnitrophota bacterium]
MNSQADNSKRFFIKTLGCKVNQYESQAMREILLRAGFKECLARDIADIYILNTCTVTNRADKESRYWLGFFHKANPKAKIVVTGCYVERDSNDISFLPGIAHIIKNDEKNRIAEILTNANPVAQYPMPTAQGPYNPLTITDFKNHTKAFVKIQDGCENCCSYCKVPLVRGPLRSRPVTDILKEVKILVEKGFKEIVLTGVCLGAWGKDPYTKAILDSWPGGKGLGL